MLAMILIVGVLAMSSASILIRWAGDQGAPSLVIGAYRLTSATLILSIPATRQRVWRDYAKLTFADFRILLLSGILLGLHFATWITSFEHTSVLSSVVLVTTTPLWLGLAAPIVLGEKTDRYTWIGIVCAIVGGIIIGLSNLDPAENQARYTLWGDLLALLGGMFAAGYLLIGRHVRSRLSLTAYLWFVYGVAAIVLTTWTLVAGYTLTGYPAAAVLWMISLGLVPQLIGHSAANYAIRYLPATLVALTILGEPIGATILAVIALNEWPVPVQLAGGAFILGGIVLAAIGNTRHSH
jgi:drug/metabolite transporter (DMT)-like permease